MSKRKIEDPVTTISPPHKLRCKEEEEDESSLDGMGKFKELPQEMFEKIVNYLPCKEKLNLALTSKAMEHAIGTNLSIMKNIVLKIPRHYMIGNVLGNRRYVNIKFHRRILKKHVPAITRDLNKLDHSVTSVDFGNSMCHGAAKEIIMIFKNVQKITNYPYRPYYGYGKIDNKDILRTYAYMTATREQINRSNAAISQIFQDKFQSPLDLPKLKFLHAESTGILSDFENSKLESLSITDGSGDDMFQVTKTKNFLEKQSSLKSLKLICSRMFQEALIKDIEIPFKLNKLQLSLKMRKNPLPETRDDFQKFVNLHRETLTHLICTLPDLHYFNGFRFLKKVEITSMHRVGQALPNLLMPFVEILSIKAPSYCNNFNVLLLGSFSNLKELEFRGSTYSYVPFYVNVENYNLNSCSFPSISMPNLKVVKFVKVTFQANQNPFEESYTNIQEVHLDGCVNFDYWLSIFIEHVDTKLNLLELRNLKISTNCYNLIKTNARKIRKINITNVFYASPSA